MFDVRYALDLMIKLQAQEINLTLYKSRLD